MISWQFLVWVWGRPWGALVTHVIFTPDALYSNAQQRLLTQGCTVHSLF
jgi:hypothetical protein